MQEQEIKERSKTYFNNTAAGYDSSPDGVFVRCMYPEILRRAQRLRPSIVLDLGCGNGNVLALLKEQIPAQYYGLDLAENMIMEARKRLGSAVSLAVGDAQALPYPANYFDLIICNASFHHYPNPQKVLLEIKRVLRREGTLILGDPTLPGELLPRLLNRMMQYSQSGDAHIWSRKTILSFLNENGMAVENFQKLNPKTFILNARKK